MFFGCGVKMLGKEDVRNLDVTKYGVWNANKHENENKHFASVAIFTICCCQRSP